MLICGLEGMGTPKYSLSYSEKNSWEYLSIQAILLGIVENSWIF